MTTSYQILPDLLPQEFEALRDSIADRGVDIPIIVDQDGNIIDGIHRQKACDELGIYCPREVRQFTSESEKFELVLRANCRRRQMNTKQRRELIGVYLRRDPQIADNSLGSLIGVSKNTVAKVRTHLETTRQIDKLDKLRGKDGKDRPTKYNRIIVNTPREAETALKIIGDLPDSCEGKTFDVTTAKRRARRNQKQKELQESVIMPLADDAIQIRHCRFQDMEIAPASVHLVLTDIPYDKSFLPQITDLAALAFQVLVEGGLLVTYSGQYWLPEVMRRLGEHLTYRWMMATVWAGDSNVIYPLGFASQWKPILVYSKGTWDKSGRRSDVSRIDCKEKDWHEWQQSLGEVETLVREFSKPGDLVVDPCGGGFTTAVACQRLGRRFVGCDVDQSCVVRGQQRLAEARLVEDLKVWIEDTEDVMLYLSERHEPYDGQHAVKNLWKRHGLDATALETCLRLLPATHQAIWQALAG